jgi:predicted DNA-binding transcriptional regulator AlpA
MIDDPFILKSDRAGLRRAGIPLSPATALRHAKSGDFPAPTKLTPGKSGWFTSTLRAWMDKKKPGAFA